MNCSKFKSLLLLLLLVISVGKLTFGQHFQNPESNYNPMTIIVMTADIGGTALEVGDEIAAYDNGICVGFNTVVDATASPLVSITAFQNENGAGTPNGYVPGNDICFRIWDVSDQSEISCVTSDFNPAFLTTYEGLGTAIANTLSGTGSIRTDISSATTCPGDVSVNVNISNFNDVASFSLRLDYNNAEVVYQDFESLNANLDANLFSITDNTDHILINYTGVADISIANGILVALNFEALTNTAEVISNLSWNTGEFNNAIGDLVPGNLFDGTITVNPLPVQPNDIAGLTVVCESSEDVVYSIAAVPGANSYTWSLSPAGMATINGNGTSIELDFDPSFIGVLTLSVFATNDCGDGESKDLDIDVINNPSIIMRTDFDNCASDLIQLSSPAGSVTAVNYSVLAWTSSGDGVFDDATAENPVYTPSANDIANGSVVLTLEAIANAPCVENAEESVTVTIVGLPEASLPDDTDLCEGETITITGLASNYDSLDWTAIDSDGELVLNNDLEIEYTPGPNDMDQGSVVIELQANSVSPCTGSASDQMTIQLQKKPEVHAGVNAEVCEDGTHQLNPVVQDASGVVWSTSGDGSFDNPTIEDAVYTPGVNDIANGSATLTISASSILPCVSTETSSMTLEIFPNPTIDPLVDEELCASESLLLTANANNYGGITWSTSGDGNFDDVNILNAEYTPGIADIEDGVVTLTLTLDGQGGCNEIDDSMLLTIHGSPVANAGTDNSVCVGNSLELTEATIGNSVACLWSTNGDGTFNDATLVNPEYTPGINDLANGTVTLSIEAEAQFPCTINSVDDMLLTIIDNPTVDAGTGGDLSEGVTCQIDGATGSNYAGVSWTTSGDGTFVDATLLNPQYIAGTQDAIDGTVTLTVEASPNAPCVGVFSDTRVLAVYPAVNLSLNANAQICEDETYQLNATVENYSTITWSSDGDGTFSNLNIPNPVYTPGVADINSGNVTLSISVIGEGTCTSAVSSELDLDIQSFAVVNAGGDEAVCETDTYTLEAGASNYTNIDWSTSGDGSFSNTNILDPIYTPGTNDIANGTVVLTVSVNSQAPCNESDTDAMTLTITQQAVVDAGADIEICEDQSVDLDADAQNYSGISWSTDGDGSFSATNILDPVYTPGSGDIANGSVILSVEVEAEAPCTDVVSDELVISITELAEVDAGVDVEICSDDVVYLAGSVVNSNTYTWTTSGDGSIATPNSLSTSYTPGANDIINGSVILTLTVDNASPCSGTVDDAVVITINNVPDQPVGLSGDQTIIILDPSVPVYGNYSTETISTADSYTWSLNPADAGTILANGSEDVTIEWSPDFDGGIVELFVSATNDCGESEISEAFEIEVDNQIGISHLENLYGLMVHPNPANDYINISFDVVNKGSHEILIYDVTGRILIYKTIFCTQNNVVEKISLSTLSQGIYSIVLKDCKNRITNKLVVE